ncbi:MAG: NYN domain-containing protein [Nitrospinae bacterium]|nr:NYN domain-containing protein [Nitrospinota bacterium]
MSILKTVIFVDGQNFKKNLQNFEFRSSTDRESYKLDEKHFLWEDFFKAVIEKFEKDTDVKHRLLRAYWYNAETISNFPDDKKASRLARQALEECRRTIPSINEQQIIDNAKSWWKNTRDNFHKARSDVFEKIQQKTNFLEFKYIGQYVVKPFSVYRLNKNSDDTLHYEGKRVGEKGVDIGLAVDMVAKMPYYDVAILISGDADFQPVVRYLKDHLKQVYQFSIAKGVPPQINYLSDYLKSIVDVFQYFDEEELLSKFLDPNTGSIPHSIKLAIENRIKELSNTKKGVASSTCTASSI